MAAGTCNQLMMLYPARFLVGALCLLTDLRLEARQVLLENDLIPSINYDSETAGYSDHISKKGLAILHQTDSPLLSVY